MVTLNASEHQEVNVELSYNLELHEGIVDAMVNHFKKVIPSRSSDAVERWSAFVSHPDVPRLITLLRDDGISNEERTEYHVELIAAAEDVFGEDVEWRHE